MALIFTFYTYHCSFVLRYASKDLKKKKKSQHTSLDYRTSAEKRTGNNGNDTGLPQNGAVGHENSIFKGVYVTKKAWASAPKRALLLSSCVTFGKSLGSSEHQLPVFNQEIQFTKIKK